nr:MAG TPA: Putative head tail adaptor [Caudoviricetes sp.]
MINAGDYKYKIKIIQSIEKKDDEGFKKKEDYIVAQPYAKVKTTKGYTLITNNSDFEKAYTNFTIRYSKQVENAYYDEDSNREMLISFKNKIYKVEYMNNVNESNIELELQAKRVTK